VTAAFATEEGAFLRGQVRMEERVDIGVTPAAPAEAAATEEAGQEAGAATQPQAEAES
jgi:hypothetical protein